MEFFITECDLQQTIRAYIKLTNLHIRKRQDQKVKVKEKQTSAEAVLQNLA